MKRINTKGLTLVEVLAVVVIIGILSSIIGIAISKYMQGGKNAYNDKLKNQLVLAGKSYYTQHKDKLVDVNEGEFVYVSLPELQSNNYVTNKFIDSEGRECSPSYVYVNQKRNNSNDYKYNPCLICQDEQGNKKNYSEEDPNCNVSN